MARVYLKRLGGLLKLSSNALTLYSQNPKPIINRAATTKQTMTRVKFHPSTPPQCKASSPMMQPEMNRIAPTQSMLRNLLTKLRGGGPPISDPESGAERWKNREP